MAMSHIVIVGCGSIGQRHARLLAKRDGLQIDLCDTNEVCLNEALEIAGERQCFTDLSAALDSNPDAVVVATPHTAHADAVIQALEKGAHVLCEKPMSDNASDARRMLDVAAATGRVLDIGFTLHFHPALQRLRSLTHSGEFGNVLHAHCRVGTYATLANSRSRHQADLEGALLFDYVHQPDLLYWITERRPSSVYMSARTCGDLALNSRPNVADIVLEYGDEFGATIHLNYVQAPQRHEYEIVGDRGWALLDMEAGVLRIGRSNGDSVSEESFEVDRDEMFIAEHQAFFDAIKGKRPPESPPERAIVSNYIVDAALTSWRKNEPIAPHYSEGKSTKS